MSADVEHPEARCHRCERSPLPRWSAASPLWNAVMRRGDVEPFDGIVCPTCFMDLATEAGFAVHFRVDSPDADVPLVAPGGRVWDPVAFLWVDPPLPV